MLPRELRSCVLGGCKYLYKESCKASWAWRINSLIIHSHLILFIFCSYLYAFNYYSTVDLFWFHYNRKFSNSYFVHLNSCSSVDMISCLLDNHFGLNLQLFLELSNYKLLIISEIRLARVFSRKGAKFTNK